MRELEGMAPPRAGLVVSALSPERYGLPRQQTTGPASWEGLGAPRQDSAARAERSCGWAPGPATIRQLSAGGPAEYSGDHSSCSCGAGRRSASPLLLSFLTR